MPVMPKTFRSNRTATFKKKQNVTTIVEPVITAPTQTSKKTQTAIETNQKTSSQRERKSPSINVSDESTDSAKTFLQQSHQKQTRLFKNNAI